MPVFNKTAVFCVVFSSLCSLATSAEESQATEQKSTAQNAVEQTEHLLVVTAEFNHDNVLELPSSVTVIDSETIQANQAQHMADLLNLAPNVNFATGASRGRFVQIRGVGERSEFKEPVNYSVGVVVDGIDMTGIATAAILTDVQQVEILRGPQGTLYGANGLAGLINLVSNAPTASPYSKISVGAESYQGRSVQAVYSGPASDLLGYRFAVHQYQSNGFMDNVYLGRDDTNNLDEASLRGKLVYQPDDKTSLTTNLLLVNIDNGYDAFSLDSNRTTYSDQPGQDRQKTRAASFVLDWQMTRQYRLEAISSMANSELAYGYDEDWSYPEICEGLDCDGWAYSSFDHYLRDNHSQSLDLRLHGRSAGNDLSDSSDRSWVVGFYIRAQQMDLQRIYTYQEGDFFSEFNTNNRALYGQVEQALSEKIRLTTGLRMENRMADYFDNQNAGFRPDENLWGGKLALEYQLAQGKMFYGLLSRGYKAGGFNTDGSLEASDREYDTEFMWNYEAGFKGYWPKSQLTLQTAVFYQDRDDIQSKQSLVRSFDSGLSISQGGICPCSFTDYIQNAAAGHSYGLELEAKWLGLDFAEFYTSLGLMRSAFDDFQSYSHAEADLEAIPPVPFDLDGRALAHSPEYQAVLGGRFFISQGWSFNLQLEAKDGFYFSDRHELQSEAYQLVNASLGYQGDNWRLDLFGRNLTDEQIQTRGFGSFGNDPRKFYQTEGYFQFAAPRVVGINASIEFN